MKHESLEFKLYEQRICSCGGFLVSDKYLVLYTDIVNIVADPSSVVTSVNPRFPYQMINFVNIASISQKFLIY